MKKQKVWNTIKHIKKTTNDKDEIRKIKCNIKILDKKNKDQINKINNDYRKSVIAKKKLYKKLGIKIKYTLNISESDKPIYKKRLKVEHFFSKLKACKLTRIYDKKINTFRETIFSRIISIYMCNNFIK